MKSEDERTVAGMEGNQIQGRVAPRWPRLHRCAQLGSGHLYNHLDRPHSDSMPLAHPQRGRRTGWERHLNASSSWGPAFIGSLPSSQGVLTRLNFQGVITQLPLHSEVGGRARAFLTTWSS